MITITPEYLESQGLSLTFPERFWIRVDFNGPVPKAHPELGHCWLWRGSRLKDGYGQVRPGGSRECIRAPRAAWIITRGPIPHGFLLCHKCDNPPCVNPEHLFLGTPLDNVRDCVNKGRRSVKRYSYNLGEHHGLAKLTWAKVDDARVRYWLGKSSIGELADECHVRFQTMWSVIRGHTWKVNDRPK